MKLFRFWLVVVSSVMACPSLLSQSLDPFFVQYEAVPLWLNPALSGANEESSIGLSSFQGPAKYMTNALSFEHSVDSTHWGGGLLLLQDATIGGQQSSIDALISVSKGVSIGEEIMVRFGANLGRFHNRTGIPIGPPDPIYGYVFGYETVKTNGTLFGGGALFQTPSLQLGISAFNINEPNVSAIGGESALPMRVQAHVEYTVPLVENEDGEVDFALSPLLLLMRQGQIRNFYAGMNVQWRKWHFGGRTTFDRDKTSNIMAFSAGRKIGSATIDVVYGSHSVLGGLSQISLNVPFSLRKAPPQEEDVPAAE